MWDTSKVLKQTKVIEDNVNPLFYETVEMSYEANSKDDLPPFVFDIYDKDFNPLDSDDFICRALIYIHDPVDAKFDAAICEDDEVPKPKWHPCRLKQGSPDCGEILVSFSIVADDYSFKTPLAYMNIMETVQFDDYQIEVSILGLRGLQSVGILPVKKAFIQFNLKSLVPPSFSQKIDNIKTQPGPAGANPTINTMIKFCIPLPGDPLYCPRLQCSVFDNIFKGFMQPLLGVFTIPVGDILQKKIVERQREHESLDYMLEELSKVLEGLGVQTYNVQEQELDEGFRELVDKQKEEVKQLIDRDTTFKAHVEDKIKVEEKKTQLFAPLLLNLDSDDRNSEFSEYDDKENTTVGKKSK